MKIALIAPINNAIGKPFKGGVETQLWWITKKLIERGHDITLFASGDSDPEFPIIPIIKQSLFTNTSFRHADGKEFINKINRHRRRAVSQKAYDKMSKVLCNDSSFDIIHNHALFDAPLFAAQSYKAPMVTTLHTPPFREIARGVKLCARAKAGKFIAVSKAISQEWQYYTQCDIVHNGINIEDWDYQENPIPKTAIWFGRITPPKGTHIAIKAALKTGYKLKLFGPIIDQNYFDQEVAPLLSSPGITYHGHVEHEELAAHIGKSAVIINAPLCEEAFGLIFIEAMACGTPVATFKSGAAGEIVTPETGIIVPKNDVNALAAAIEKAATRKREACRRHAEQNFTLDKMLDKYEAYYAKMARSTGKKNDLAG